MHNVHAKSRSISSVGSTVSGAMGHRHAHTPRPGQHGRQHTDPSLPQQLIRTETQNYQCCDEQVSDVQRVCCSVKCGTVRRRESSGALHRVKWQELTDFSSLYHQGTHHTDDGGSEFLPLKRRSLCTSLHGATLQITTGHLQTGPLKSNQIYFAY